MSDADFIKQYQEMKFNIIKECCEYFSKKYELNEYYKEFNIEEDIEHLCEKIIFLKLNKLSNKARGGKKKNNDPNQPKKPKSSYFCFLDKHRNDVKEENPNYTIGDISKLLGNIWSGLESYEKKPYEEEALKDKEKYKNEIKKYNKI